MRLIDANALYEKVQGGEELARKRVLDTETTLPYPTNLNPAYTRYLAQMDERTKLKHMIADAPTVHPEPPKIGKWIKIGYIEHTYLISRCSACGYQTIDAGNYCTNCGAKMEGEKCG